MAGWVLANHADFHQAFKGVQDPRQYQVWVRSYRHLGGYFLGKFYIKLKRSHTATRWATELLSWNDSDSDTLHSSSDRILCKNIIIWLVLRRRIRSRSYHLLRFILTTLQMWHTMTFIRTWDWDSLTTSITTVAICGVEW